MRDTLNAKMEMELLTDVSEQILHLEVAISANNNHGLNGRYTVHTN